MKAASKTLIATVGTGGLLSKYIAEEMNKQNFMHWEYEKYKRNQIEHGKSYISEVQFFLEVKKTAIETVLDIYEAAEFVAEQLATI